MVGLHVSCVHSILLCCDIAYLTSAVREPTAHLPTRALCGHCYPQAVITSPERCSLWSYCPRERHLSALFPRSKSSVGDRKIAQMYTPFLASLLRRSRRCEPSGSGASLAYA